MVFLGGPITPDDQESQILEHVRTSLQIAETTHKIAYDVAMLLTTYIL